VKEFHEWCPMGSDVIISANYMSPEFSVSIDYVTKVWSSCAEQIFADGLI
jgi:hypothetical protein